MKDVQCIQEGNYIENRMTFPEINSTLRTDELQLCEVEIETYCGKVTNILPT